MKAWVVLLALCFAATAEGRVRHPPIGPYKHAASPRHGILTNTRSEKLISQCEERYRDTRLDWFTWESNTTFQQRYFVCKRHWKEGGPIFFYLGNEADVTLYLNNTGLMWELAPRHDALLVFAEHRYYGQSKPFSHKTLRKHMAWLTSEQAMADYASLIWELREEVKDRDAPVIGFGGSYGGMLATWFRLKYPHLMDGAIAGSAPIWTYKGEEPPYDPGSFAKIVTRDASPAGGSAAACAPNVREAWQTLFHMGRTEEGRAAVGQAMSLCEDSQLGSEEDVQALADWASSAWDYLAMGDYPYPSTYILNGNGELPAFPVRAACRHLAQPGLRGEALLSALAAAVGVFYNFSGADLPCFSFKAGPNPETEEDGDFWGWQYCTEQFQPFSKDGKEDMFWAQPFSTKQAIKDCRATWGVEPLPLKPTIEWGGKRIASASNIVFSNGLLDPWSGGGVLQDLSETLVAVIIPEGAHHLDLMFSHPLDPPSVKRARQVEEAHITRWIKDARARSSKRSKGQGGPMQGLLNVLSNRLASSVAA